MPGAGSTPAGAFPAGYDPGVVSAAAAGAIPLAALFQLSTADFPVDADGRFLSVHPVDQWVALQLSTRQGTLYSVPDAGHRLRSVTRLSAAKALSLATDIVRQALADAVARGDIRIDRIEVDTSHRGVLLVAVTYTNLRIHPPRPTTARTNLS